MSINLKVIALDGKKCKNEYPEGYTDGHVENFLVLLKLMEPIPAVEKQVCNL